MGESARFGSVKALNALNEIETPKAVDKIKWLSSGSATNISEIREKAKILLQENANDKP